MCNGLKRVKACATIFVKDESGWCVWCIMSSDAADQVNLSYSAGKSGPVQRTNARVRKPNSSLDHEGASLERIRELRKKRGGVLSSLSAKRREIDSLLTDEVNLEAVKIKLPEITSLFRKFADAQQAYHAALTDAGQRQESEVYFAEIESSLDFFCRTVNDWLRVTEARLQDNLVTPDDSASQVEIGLRNTPKPSECGSRSTRLSKTSSISAARAKEAARIAELRAEVLALNQRHSLQETELLLKRQEYELQLKKDELNLKTEYAKALAREEAYAQAEVGNFVPNKVPASYIRADVPDVSANTKVKWTDGVKSSQFASSGEKKEGTVKAKVNLAAIDQSSVASGSSSGSEKSGLSDMAYDILAQQNRVMKEFVSQQQRNSLPRRRVPVFSGNPLDYCTFIRAFETVIETRESDYAGRLYYLEQHTPGRPQELVRSCLYMNAEAGYLKARKLLESNFGQKHKIAMAYVDKVTNGPFIRAEDSEALESFATLLASCTNTLKAIGTPASLKARIVCGRLSNDFLRSFKLIGATMLTGSSTPRGETFVLMTFPCSLSRRRVLCLTQSLENCLSWKRKGRIAETEARRLKLRSVVTIKYPSLPLLTRSLPVHPVVIRPIQPTLPRGSAPFAMQIIPSQNVPVSLKCSQLTSVTSL